ncbi:hypothetical protein Tco_0044071 [Tanacetum coccineum]
MASNRQVLRKDWLSNLALQVQAKPGEEQRNQVEASNSAKTDDELENEHIAGILQVYPGTPVCLALNLLFMGGL